MAHPEPHIAIRAAVMSDSTAQTRQIGEQLGRLLQAGDLICLQGDLGSGKTCLTQGIGRGLGITASITSPTFVLISEYHVPGNKVLLYHIDLYRLETTRELEALGLDEIFDREAVVLVEWGERFPEVLPENRMEIRVRATEDDEHLIEIPESLTI